MEKPPANGRILRSALKVVIGLALFVGIGALTVRYVVIDLPGEIARRAADQAAGTARQVAEEVARAFQVQPRVTVGSRVIVEQQTAVLQLVTLEKTTTQRLHLDDSWLHSTKTLEIEGDFKVRAGFDLTKPFVIAMERTGNGLHVTLPPAEILSVGLGDVRFLRDEDGLWNKLTPEDRENALRELRKRIEREAANSRMLQQAREIAEKRLAALLGAGGRTVTFEPEAKP